MPLVGFKYGLHENLVISKNYIDLSLCSPLIYNLRHYYTLGKKMSKDFRAETDLTYKFANK